MSERTSRNNKAFIESKRHVLDLISYYYDHHPTVYISDEKNYFYTYAIKTAYREVSRSHDTPLNVLERMLTRFDEWAHTGCSNDYVFSVSVSAVEDIIDLILTS